MKLCRLFRVFRSLPYSIWFNFHYLPFGQAVRLPILLYKPTLKKCAGRVILEGKAYPGRVRLGFPNVPIYPNNGIMWENSGTVKFEGRCSIGNSSYISVGRFGNLVLGDKFVATTALRLICFHAIEFGEQVLVGWDNLFCDTDFHKIKGGGFLTELLQSESVIGSR